MKNDPGIRQQIPCSRTASASKTKLSASVVKLLVVLTMQLPALHAMPLGGNKIIGIRDEDEPELSPGEDGYWLNMFVSFVLVVSGGVFAGLTLSLMSSDEVNLQVVEQTGSAKERKDARKVLNLLQKGKHWVLVTLLLSNVITNESLPIVLDRVLGGGWPAIVSSTVAIVIFGEIIPQSISVRYGLGVGAFFAPFVLALMWFMYPVAYPTAKLLDYLLGEDHGTVYKRAGLKSLVTLHQTMGVERLNEDEVTIISAVLDLKEKPVGAIMTPMDDVFVMSSDRILDEATIEQILHTGFNRIPIHAPGEADNFIGMLLVRILITYDPEDALPISSFPLATLPETGPDTSCLNILNYFQEGKSHMVVISENPGEPHGAMGVLTLEDVIEELIGEEIIDESDVYIDVAKSIRRVQPGPLNKRNSMSRGEQMHYPQHQQHQQQQQQQQQYVASTTSPRRASLGLDPAFAALANESDLSKLKLGPLNKASNPRMTGNRNVHIKRQQTGESKDVTRDSQQLLSTSNGVPINVHRTEQGAVNEFYDNYSPRTSNTGGQPPSTKQPRTRSPSPELHSYRTGGIVESVVNVDGVSKTVIEDVSGSESETATTNSSRRRAHSKRTSDDDDDDDHRNGGPADDDNGETRPLLSD